MNDIDAIDVSIKILLRVGEYFNKLQKLIDAMLEFENEDNVCEVTQKQLGAILGVSQSAIAKYKAQINSEETVIETVKNGYIVYNKNMNETKLYKKAEELINDIANLYAKPENIIAEEYGVKRRTIQMAKSLINEEIINELKREPVST